VWQIRASRVQLPLLSNLYPCVLSWRAHVYPLQYLSLTHSFYHICRSTSFKRALKQPSLRPHLLSFPSHSPLTSTHILNIKLHTSHYSSCFQSLLPFLVTRPLGDGGAGAAAAGAGAAKGDDELETYEGDAANSTPPFLRCLSPPSDTVPSAAAGGCSFLLPPFFFDPKSTPPRPLKILYPQYAFKKLGRINALLATRTNKGKPEATECGEQIKMAQRLCGSIGYSRQAPKAKVIRRPLRR